MIEAVDFFRAEILMLFLILIAAAIFAAIWWFSGDRSLSRNERLYLRRRGYDPSDDRQADPPVSKDTRLFSLIESLSDISPYARQRAAEDISRMCASGRGDARMLASLIAALDDSDASVRSSVATALGNIGDRSSVEALKRRMDVEDSIQVRTSLERALEKLLSDREPPRGQA